MAVKKKEPKPLMAVSSAFTLALQNVIDEGNLLLSAMYGKDETED